MSMQKIYSIFFSLLFSFEIIRLSIALTPIYLELVRVWTSSLGRKIGVRGETVQPFRSARDICIVSVS